MDTLSANYRRLEDATATPINYAPAATRFAYVYSYVAAHADYVRQVLEMADEHIDDLLLRQQYPLVSCIGGGPGSEMLGTLQYVLNHHNRQTQSLMFYLCDKEGAWADAWSEIGRHLGTLINVTSTVQPIDVLLPHTYRDQRKFLKADLFVSSYFFSEVARFGAQTDAFWDDIGQNAKAGAKFVVLDNDSPGFVAFIRAAMQRAGFRKLEEKGVSMWPRSSEQMSDLKEYLDRFGRSPRLKAKLWYGVFEKV
ncbi:hypothetical protein [Luteibacter aegosomatissinici]|uniref:hypothetical protein n=1 Tax=Luteibacter aegosomatissinici TaxID=2911539 RepID=UPI001FF92BFE|nr:hypothetical protein [Luteibacter aegosomatissinici]UPG92859.1 hypothetical protein L2Y97_13390 [Luteibacter aegosomatissinici]